MTAQQSRRPINYSLLKDDNSCKKTDIYLLINLFIVTSSTTKYFCIQAISLRMWIKWIKLYPAGLTPQNLNELSTATKSDHIEIVSRVVSMK